MRLFLISCIIFIFVLVTPAVNTEEANEVQIEESAPITVIDCDKWTMPEPTPCPDDKWILVDDKWCYQATKKKVWKSTAVTTCSGLHENAHLPRFHDTESWTAFLNPAVQKKLKYRMAWLDLSDAKTEGTFLWGDDSALEYTNWDDDQPDGKSAPRNPESEGVDCAVISKPRKQKWQDRECDNKFSAICQIAAGEYIPKVDLAKIPDVCKSSPDSGDTDTESSSAESAPQELSDKPNKPNKVSNNKKKLTKKQKPTATETEIVAKDESPAEKVDGMVESDVDISSTDTSGNSTTASDAKESPAPKQGKQGRKAQRASKLKARAERRKKAKLEKMEALLAAALAATNEAAKTAATKDTDDAASINKGTATSGGDVMSKKDQKDAEKADSDDVIAAEMDSEELLDNDSSNDTSSTGVELSKKELNSQIDAILREEQELNKMRMKKLEAQLKRRMRKELAKRRSVAKKTGTMLSADEMKNSIRLTAKQLLKDRLSQCEFPKEEGENEENEGANSATNPAAEPKPNHASKPPVAIVTNNVAAPHAQSIYDSIPARQVLIVRREEFS